MGREGPEKANQNRARRETGEGGQGPTQWEVLKMWVP